VFYRASFQHEARSRELAGWVRNLTDGSVEFLVQGDAKLLQQQLKWAQEGPRGARVLELEIQEVPADPGLTSFEIRH